MSCIRRILSFLCAAAFVAASTAAASAAPFVLSSPDFRDGGTLSSDAAGVGECGGKGISPALAWSGAPASTKSIAIVVVDADGRNATGVVHWVAYNIKPTTTSFPAGLASQPSPLYVGGLNNRNQGTFLWLCPPPGDRPHHYIFTAYALDLPPGALPPGLSRDAFFAAISGHVVAGSVLVATYAR